MKYSSYDNIRQQEFIRHEEGRQGERHIGTMTTNVTRGLVYVILEQLQRIRYQRVNSTLYWSNDNVYVTRGIVYVILEQLQRIRYLRVNCTCYS